MLRHFDANSNRRNLLSSWMSSRGSLDAVRLCDVLV